MAERLPNLAQFKGRLARGWHEYANYQVVHENHIDALVREGIVVRDTLRFLESVADDGSLMRVNLRGRIVTEQGAVVIVNKWLSVRSAARLEVRTDEYAYHAFVRLPKRQDMFRYDSCHGLDGLHCHRFDTEGDIAAIDDVELDKMPPLSYAISEANELARWLRNR